MDLDTIGVTAITDSEQQVDKFFHLFHKEIQEKHFSDVTARMFTAYRTKLDDYTALVETQHLFEAVAQRDTTVALCLMAELYDKAGELRAHDVGDSIELWIEAEGDKDFLAYVATQLEQSDRATMRDTYQSWIAELQIKLSDVQG